MDIAEDPSCNSHQLEDRLILYFVAVVWKNCIHKELMIKFLPDRAGCRDWAFREATEATMNDLKVGKLAWEILTARRC
jgi:hypothetical protein